MMLRRQLYLSLAPSIKSLVSEKKSVQDIADIEMIFKYIGRESLKILLTHFCPNQVITSPIERCTKTKKFELNPYTQLLKIVYYTPDQSKTFFKKVYT